MSRVYDLTEPGDDHRLLLHTDIDGKPYLQHIYDVEPILERNKALQTYDGLLPMERGEGNFRRVATFPNGIIEKWKKELGVDVMNREHLPKVMALLRQPEWRYLVSAPGKI